MNKRLLSLLVSISLANIAFADGQDNTTVTLEDITVIGEKLDKSLKDTTSSVSVIGDDVLRTTRNQTVREAIAAVPNVVTPTGAVPNIRGVSGNGAAGGFNSITGGANPRVSILIDGVAEPFVADFTGDSGLWDVEQIEVYRGPQSSNNGRNSIGGAIYIKTKDPSFDWEGAVRLGYRNEENYIDKAVMLSGPIIEDKLAFRISGQLIDAQTTTSNDEYSTNPAGFDLNEIDTEKGRIKLLWKATENLDALFTYSKNEEQGDTGRRYFRGDDPSSYEKIFIRNIETDSDTASLKVDFQLNDAMSLDLLVSATDYDWGFKQYGATAAADQYLNFEEDNKFIDAKLNFGENNKTFNGYVGLAYFERDQEVASTGAYIYDGKDKADTKSIYTQLNYAVTDRFTITGGMRYQNETQKRHFVYGAIDTLLEEKNTIFLPKLVLQYDVTDETRVALSARKGYNSGGGALDYRAAEYYYYDEEKVEAYELSVHSDLAGGTVKLRGNLFYNIYDGYQGQNSLRRIVNIDEVVTYGAELEVSTLLTPDLELRLGVGLLNTEIKDGGDDYADIKGNELNTAPKSTITVGTTYYVTDEFDIGANFNYIGGSYGDIENTDDREVGGYTLINLNANYEVENWLISAYVNNVTDKEALRVKEPVGRANPLGYADLIAPRHFGVSATYSF